MRFLRKLVAFFRRTFITDCPVCHKHFYGFHTYGVHHMINGINYRIVCHRCMASIGDKNV